MSDDWERNGIAARLSPRDVHEDVPVRQGRAPQMTVNPWFRIGQGVETGRTEDGDYWRCRETGCRRFAGPYQSVMDASEDGHDHRNLAHTPERRRQAREERQQSRGRSR